MAVAAYGATNPAGTDPWPIESIIAKEALTGNPSAHAMLADYRMAREADTNLYNQSMVGQHEFAKKQLEDAMTQARWKAIPEFLARGQAGAELIAPGAGLGIGDAITPDAAARSLQASRVGEFAKNFAEQGKGAESFSRAGQDITAQQIPGLQNIQTTGAGQHSDITVEELKAQNALQIAAMHAKAKGAGGPSEGSYSAPIPVGPETGGLAIQSRSAKGEHLNHYVQRLLDSVPSYKAAHPPPPGGDPGAGASSASTQSTSGSSARGRSNAGAAARNVAPVGRVANAAPGAVALQQVAQTHAETVIRKRDPAAYQDIMQQAQRNGGAVQLGRDANGYYLQGVQGQHR